MKFKYDWEKYPEIVALLTKIYEGTAQELESTNYHECYIEEFMEDLEDYIYYLKSHYYNLPKIINSLKEVDAIGFMKPIFLVAPDFKPDLANCPKSMNAGNKVLINPTISSDKRLFAKERRRLYLYSALSQRILKLRTENTKKFNTIYSSVSPYDRSRSEYIINCGWQLLEETLSQVLAERITYKTIDKPLPGPRPGLEKEVYPLPSHLISSSIESYRPFEQTLIYLGLTLSKISSLDEHSEQIIMHDLLKKAINSNLSDAILTEYFAENHQLELYQVLYLMGLLLNEKYATYGLRKLNDSRLLPEEVEEIYKNIHGILIRLINLSSLDYEKEPIEPPKLDTETRKKILTLIRTNDIYE